MLETRLLIPDWPSVMRRFAVYWAEESRFRSPAPDSLAIELGRAVQANALRTPASANHVLLGPQESAFSVREQALPISNSGAKRRSTRISYAVPLVVTWNDRQSHTVVEEATTLSINCHGFRYFAKQRPQKNACSNFPNH